MTSPLDPGWTPTADLRAKIEELEKANDEIMQILGKGWQPMDTAPKDREILVRRHNDCFMEHYIVRYDFSTSPYVWAEGPVRSNGADHRNAYTTDRLDAWHEIPA